MKKSVIIIFILAAVAARSNPVVRGTWSGVIIQYDEAGSQLKIPCTLYINDNDQTGDLSGEITLTYNYKSGQRYTCKANFTGKIDYQTYNFSLNIGNYVYYDVLPENMQWCLGSISGSVRREMEFKLYIILAKMGTKCSETPTESDVVLLKQQ